MINYSNIFDKDGISYVQYRLLIDNLLAKGQTTGPDQSEGMIHYTKMNVQRMSRLEKTVNLNDELIQFLASLNRKYQLLVISEGWCGDAAQIVPVINKMTMAAPDKLELKLVLRDEHPDLMAEHLTNGGKAIPVLLVIDAEQGGLLAKWGPRPAILQNLLAQWRLENVVMPELAEQLHGWYAKDKTQHTQEELLHLMKSVDIGN